MNFSAASVFFEPAGIARFHAHSQLAFLPSPVLGASAKPTLSATLESFGLVTKDAATVASIHMPHLPALNSARFSLKPLELAPEEFDIAVRNAMFSPQPALPRRQMP